MAFSLSTSSACCRRYQKQQCERPHHLAAARDGVRVGSGARTAAAMRGSSDARNQMRQCKAEMNQLGYARTHSSRAKLVDFAPASGL